MLKMTLFLIAFLAFSGCDKPEKKPRGVNLSGYEQHVAQSESPRQHAAQSIAKAGKIATGDTNSRVIKRKRRIFK